VCLINPKVDLAFKKLFGSEENKDLLKSLLNAILPPNEKLSELQLKNPYNLADYMEGKLSILDIKAVDEKGKWYDIEMQVEPLRHYGQKALFYWGKVFTNQIESGGLYSKLNKTIVISILDFIYFPNDERHHRIFSLRDIETHETCTGLDYMDLHFIELKKFKKGLKEIKTTLDRWITFLNNAYKYEKGKIPGELAKDKEVQKAIEKLDLMYLNEKEREYYEAAQKAARDSAEALITAKEEGEKKKAVEMAKMLKENGVDISLIVKSSGLSKEEIEKL
jgi:predicted transposase/invertase (TIGR01784 family)